jgi:hypothetical protein
MMDDSPTKYEPSLWWWFFAVVISIILWFVYDFLCVLLDERMRLPTAFVAVATVIAARIAISLDQAIQEKLRRRKSQPDGESSGPDPILNSPSIIDSLLP